MAELTTKTLTYMGITTPAAKADVSDIELNDMEKAVIILVGSGAQTYFCGSKSKNSKKNQMKDAGYRLEGKGLLNCKYVYGGYDASLTDLGQDYFDNVASADVSSVVRRSAAQQERQAERINGQYSTMNTCDYCGKRGGGMYATDKGGIICEKCSAEGKDQE